MADNGTLWGDAKDPEDVLAEQQATELEKSVNEAAKHEAEAELVRGPPKKAKDGKRKAKAVLAAESPAATDDDGLDLD